MILEHILAELEKLNHNLSVLTAGTVSVAPEPEPDNSTSDEAETPVKLASKRTYYTSEEGNFQMVEKGQPVPDETVWNRTTKREYDLLVIAKEDAQEPAAEPEPAKDGGVQQELPLQTDEAPSEEMCRNALRAYRAELLQQSSDDRQANVQVFEILKMYSENGKLPEVPEADYPALYETATNALLQLTA